MRRSNEVRASRLQPLSSEIVNSKATNHLPSMLQSSKEQIAAFIETLPKRLPIDTAITRLEHEIDFSANTARAWLPTW